MCFCPHEKFDGERRNPWNEAECVANYARSMASYALLNAISGFEFDATKGMIGFSPVITNELFTSFWSLDSALGTGEFSAKSIVLNVLYGPLSLEEFRSAVLDGKVIKKVQVDKLDCEFALDGRSLVLKEPVKIKAGEKLKITPVYEGQQAELKKCFCLHRYRIFALNGRNVSFSY